MAGVGENSTARMTYDVVEGGDRTLTVRLAGELDITNVEAIGAAVAPALERDPVRLIIDARDLRFADSSAIALWVQWARSVPEIPLQPPQRHHLDHLRQRAARCLVGHTRSGRADGL